MSTIHHSSSALANPNNQEEGVKAMKGIDKRPNKDGTSSYVHISSCGVDIFRCNIRKPVFIVLYPS